MFCLRRHWRRTDSALISLANHGILWYFHIYIYILSTHTCTLLTYYYFNYSHVLLTKLSELILSVSNMQRWNEYCRSLLPKPVAVNGLDVVTWCHVMSRDVTWCHVMSRDVTWSIFGGTKFWEVETLWDSLNLFETLHLFAPSRSKQIQETRGDMTRALSSCTSGRAASSETSSLTLDRPMFWWTQMDRPRRSHGYGCHGRWFYDISRFSSSIFVHSWNVEHGWTLLTRFTCWHDILSHVDLPCFWSDWKCLAAVWLNHWASLSLWVWALSDSMAVRAQVSNSFNQLSSFGSDQLLWLPLISNPT